MVFMKLLQLKNNIKDEYEKVKNEPTSTVIGKRSIYISIIMVVYAFIIIGSSVRTDITIMLILGDFIRIIGIIFGVYLLYLNVYMTSLQFKLNKNWIGILAIVCNVMSIFYFFFVSFASIIEMINTY